MLEYTFKAIKLANKYRLRRKAKKKRGQRTKYLSFSHRVSLFVAMVFVAVCLIALSPDAAKWFSPNTAAPAKSVSSPVSSNTGTDILLNTSENMANKIITLRASGAADITMYPAQSTDVLSSATIDEKTANLSYMQNAGKGGVTSASANPAPTDDPKTICQNEVSNIKGMKYVGDHANLDPADCAQQGDFLTGTGTGKDGALFQLIPALTYNMPAVNTLLKGMQGLALALLVPLIMLMGLNFMTGGGAFRFADLVESVPRLMLGVIGVVACAWVPQLIIDATNALSAGFIDVIGGAGNNAGVGDLIGTIMPSNMWLMWILILNALGLALMIANVVAPLMILGNDFGAFIAIAILVVLYGAVAILAPEFIKTTFSMLIAGQVVIRFILIDLYIVLSPIAVIAIGLPGRTGVQFAHDWIMGFLSLVISQFAVVAVLGLGVALANTYAATKGHSDMVHLIMQYAILGLMLRVPSLFKTNAVGLIGQAGNMASSMMQHEVTPFAPK